MGAGACRGERDRVTGRGALDERCDGRAAKPAQCVVVIVWSCETCRVRGVRARRGAAGVCGLVAWLATG